MVAGRRSHRRIKLARKECRQRSSQKFASNRLAKLKVRGFQPRAQGLGAKARIGMGPGSGVGEMQVKPIQKVGTLGERVWLEVCGGFFELGKQALRRLGHGVDSRILPERRNGIRAGQTVPNWNKDSPRHDDPLILRPLRARGRSLPSPLRTPDPLAAFAEALCSRSFPQPRLTCPVPSPMFVAGGLLFFPA